MPNAHFQQTARQILDDLKNSGQLKSFNAIISPMAPSVEVAGSGETIVLCSNNYLGLSNHPEVIQAGIDGLKKYGAGTASVRFICGTLECHYQLEQKIAQFLGTESALSYVSCWNANAAVFPTLTAPGDVVLSDELNHASIIDSCRLVSKKVERSVYRHNDMEDLERQLKAHSDKNCRWVVADGVFSMEGDLVNLRETVDLCKKYDAMMVLDDSHGVGVMGKTGRGTHEHFDLLGEIDIMTGTLGKALGGAAGGYVAASSDVIKILEQRARPSLFSNALPATVACSAYKAIDILEKEPQRITKLHENVAKIRNGLGDLGFACPDSPSAIVPIMIGDEAEAIRKGERLLELGIMVVGFAFPVVPRGEARLRIQVSSALEDEHIRRVLEAFSKL